MKDYAGVLGTAVLAAAIALLGNWLLLRFQTKAKVRAERRAFVRDLHPTTVDLVVDLDLFVRSIRSDVIGGATDRSAVKQRIEAAWEGDLLRRVRRARFGHPDPDVRDAADGVEGHMWTYITTAMKEEQPPPPIKPLSEDQRGIISQEMEAVLKELRRAVYVAPNRDVPREIRYDGSNYQGQISRAFDPDRRTGSPPGDT